MLFTREMLDRCIVEDNSLPHGVMEFRGADGLWWRYPLIEFVEVNVDV